MKNKGKLKLILDAVMLLIMLVLFKKSAIPMKLHEVAGLVAIGVMLIHLGINFLWVIGITPKLFSKKLPARTIISYVINALMFIDLIVLLISSIMISKTIFSVRGGFGWQGIHFCTAQVLVTLIGLHFGLHFNYITNLLSTKKSKTGKIIFISLFSVIAIFGVYSICTTSYFRQISSPFTMKSAQKKFSGERKMPPEGFMEDGMKERFENGERPEFGKGRGEGFEFGGERGFGERREFSEGEERGQRMGKGNGQGMKNAGGKGPMGKISPKNLAKTAGQTFSIIIFYAMISFLLGELAAKIKAKKIKDE